METINQNLTPKEPLRDPTGQVLKPPVVVVLGHVDSGKCVIPKTLVPLSNGEIFSIETIWEKYTQGSNRQYIKIKEGWISKPSSKIEVFSFDGSKVVKRPVSYIWKLKSPLELIKITLTSGDEVVVTPEHPFFVFSSEGEIEQKKADLLSKRDFIIAPQKLKLSTSPAVIKKKIIQRLETLKNFIVFLNNKEGEEFLEKLRQVNKQELYRKNLFSTEPRAALQKKRFQARDFVKIGRYFGFSYQKLYEMINSFKNTTEGWRAGHNSNKIKLPKIPEDLEELGYIIGSLSGDGQTEHGILYNSNPEIQNIFQNYIKKVFDLSSKIIKTRTSFKVESFGYKTLTRFLTDVLDFPQQKKSKEINFSKIFSNSSHFIKGFISGWFDTDGYISQGGELEFTSRSKDLIKTISILLLSFGIHSRVLKKRKKIPNSNKKRTYYYLKIANYPYLLKFLNNFPIKNSFKKQRIQKAIKRSSTSRIFDLTPLSGTALKTFYINEHLFPYFSKYRQYRYLSRFFLRKLLKWKNKIILPKIFSQPAVETLLNPGEISSIKIKKIEKLRNKHKFVYDLTISSFHNFVAERVFVHNTSILDFIRKTQVAEKEIGGITQHIGAYQIERDGKKITFIDTPGHEAFSAMRSRGTKVADIAILVIDTAEGIQAQTREVISHIKKAQIPFIVVLNKIDKPEANSEKVKKELQKEEILVEDLGGKVPSVETSAKTGQGIDELLDLISLIAEMESLKVDIQKPGEGVAIESYLDSQRGPTATLILNQGILKLNDIAGTPSTLGKIKILENFQGKPIEKLFPGEPGIIIGFEAVPRVGESFKVFSSLEEAGNFLRVKEKKETPQVLEIRPEQKVLNLILKADVLGSIEAIKEVLRELPQEKVILRILKSEVGEINESDIKLARSGRGIILGFRTKSNLAAKKIAEREKIKIMNFEIIYDLVEGIRKFMEKIVTPTTIREELGKVKVLAIFLTEKNRQIVGGKVIEGEVKKGVQIEILRDEELIGQGKLINLQRSKKDIERVGKGEECGILYEGEVKIEAGDVLVIYTEERRKGEL